jgi:hypothetical protein
MCSSELGICTEFHLDLPVYVQWNSKSGVQAFLVAIAGKGCGITLHL